MTLQRSILCLAIAFTLGAPLSAAAQDHDAPMPPKLTWSFGGPFGMYDRAQLQRGFKVYREVCSTCHSLDLISFRNLADAGGPGFSAAQAAAVAAEYSIKDIDDTGQPIERKGRPADHFPNPFPNEAAARATHGAVPPDMSVLAKARGYERGFPRWILDMVTAYQEHGVDYIAALLQGYEEAPKDFAVPDGAYYNKYFPGHVTKMRPPLEKDRVTYEDGTPQTVEQYSKDIAAFLMWAAEPKLEQRKRIGFQVLIFLIVFSGLLYFTKKKVWSSVH